MTVGLAIAADVGLVAGRSAMDMAGGVVRLGLVGLAGTLPVQKFGGAGEGTAIGSGVGVGAEDGMGSAVEEGHEPAAMVCLAPRPSRSDCGEN